MNKIRIFAYAFVAIFTISLFAGLATAQEEDYMDTTPEAPETDYWIEDENPYKDGHNSLNVEFYICALVDKNGDSVFSYEVDFNGDKEMDRFIEYTDEDPILLEHTYEEPGTYTVSVFAIDRDGQRSTSEDIEVEVTDARPDGPENWDHWLVEEKEEGKSDDLVVNLDYCTVRSTMDTTGDPVINCLSYEFCGTCSDDISVVYIYQDFSDYGLVGYYPFFDFDEFRNLEVEAAGGCFSWYYQWESEIPRDQYEAFQALTEMTGEEEELEPVEYRLAALAWTEDGEYCFDEKEFVQENLLIEPKEPEVPFIEKYAIPLGIGGSFMALRVIMVGLFFVIISTAAIVNKVQNFIEKRRQKKQIKQQERQKRIMDMARQLTAHQHHDDLYPCGPDQKNTIKCGHCGNWYVIERRWVPPPPADC